MAETFDRAASVSPADEAAKPSDARSLTELLEQLGRELSVLGVSEAQLEAARNMPQVRRAARDVAGTVVVVIAALTAFAFINVAAMDGLSRAVAPWLAALVLAAGWAAVGVLLLGFLGRVRRWLTWIAFSAPPTEAVQDLERDRDAAAHAALETIEGLGPVLAAQIALAAVPDAGDIASEVFGAGDEVLEGVDEFVEGVTEQLPAGGMVNQAWAVVLMPGRLGIKVATTVFQRGRPADRSAQDTESAQDTDGAADGRDPAHR